MSGGITAAARIVEERDLKAAQTWFVGRQRVDSATAILLAVEREVVFKHKHREFGWYHGRGFDEHGDERLSGRRYARIHPPAEGCAVGKRSAAHAVGMVLGVDVERVGTVTR